MKRKNGCLALAFAGLLALTAAPAAELEEVFQNPNSADWPADSQVGVFWFWANTATREGIRRDLEEMKQAGIRRAVLGMTTAHTATVESGGVVFLTPEWLALFRYALDEAARLGIRISAVMSNGWYQGGPWVTPEMGAQMLVCSETPVTGPSSFSRALPDPDKFRKGRRAGISKQARGHFKPVAVLAFRQNDKGELLKDSMVRLDDKTRPETPKPGDVYFAGTHFNPGITWWKYAGEFFAYLNRCQAMLTAGKPVVDILHVDGPETQALIQMNESRSLTSLGKCDVAPGDLLIGQLKALPDGRVGLANGASYAVLAVANTAIEPEVLEKIVQLAREGATVWLRAIPKQANKWTGSPDTDTKIAACLRELGAENPPGLHPIGKGRVIVGDMPVKEVLSLAGLPPAFSYTPDDGQPFLDYSQHQDGDTDIFFVANWKDAPHRAECSFRVTGKQPEIWNPVTGKIEAAADYQIEKDAVRVPLEFPACGSTFVVFRKRAEGDHSQPLPKKTAGKAAATQPFPGPWQIEFQPAREGEPKFEITSPELFEWSASQDKRISAFAGTATYRTTFEVNSKFQTPNSKSLLDLGVVHDLAEVLVNGKPAGIVWTAPFSLDIARLVQPGKNTLEILVTNTWHNWRLANKFLPVQHSCSLSMAMPTRWCLTKKTVRCSRNATRRAAGRSP